MSAKGDLMYVKGDLISVKGNLMSTEGDVLSAKGDLISTQHFNDVILFPSLSSDKLVVLAHTLRSDQFVALAPKCLRDPNIRMLDKKYFWNPLCPKLWHFGVENGVI